MYDIFDFDRFGVYIAADGKRFYSKIECVLYCSKRDIEYEWEFNDHYYDQLDWSVEPELSINELYARRARELREKYDHLVLHFSGGNDSGAIIETFMLNDIKLDEVNISAPQLIVDPNPNDRTAKNTYAEVALCATPNAQFVRDKYQPDLKITYSETDKHSVVHLLEKDWMESTHGDLNPGGKFRTHFNRLNQRFIELTDRGRTVAHIDGIEKPKYVVRGQDLWAVFGDWIGHRAPDRSDPNEVSLVEHFFWSPSTAELVCKQGHMILNKINSMPNSMSRAKWLMTERGRHHEDWISDIIYPGRILPKWDADKSRNTVVREWDTWFYRDKNTEYYQNWKKGMDYLDKELDQKWKRSNTIYNGGLLPKWSKPRKIGRINQNIIQG
jgi:hypothetical protein